MQPIITLPTKNPLCLGSCPISVTGGQGTVLWYTKSAAGGISFAPATAENTTVTVTSPGTYVICARYTLDLTDTGMCALQPRVLDGACPSGLQPTFVEWRALPPFTSPPVIFSPNQLSTFIMGTAEGTVQFELKCWFYGPAGANPGTNVETVPIPPIYPAPVGNYNSYGNQILSCPMAVVAGQTATPKLVGCETEQVVWSITTPTAGMVTQTGQNGGSIATSIIDTGVANVSVTCTNPVTGAANTLTCDVPIIAYDPVAILTCETVVYEEVFDNCGFTCTTAAESLTFVDCTQISCTEAYKTIKAAPICG